MLLILWSPTQVSFMLESKLKKSIKVSKSLILRKVVKMSTVQKFLKPRSLWQILIPYMDYWAVWAEIDHQRHRGSYEPHCGASLGSSGQWCNPSICHQQQSLQREGRPLGEKLEIFAIIDAAFRCRCCASIFPLTACSEPMIYRGSGRFAS